MTWYALRSSQRMEVNTDLSCTLTFWLLLKVMIYFLALSLVSFIPKHLLTCTLYRNKILAQKLLSNLSKDIENETHFILEFGCLHLEQQIVG